MQASASLAYERTQLAWRRTALAQIAFSAIAIKLALLEDSKLIISLAGIAVILAVVSYVYSRAKHVAPVPAYAVLIINTIVVALLATVSIILVR
jgi:uncharacterized membrane protein YidH (DUF202 family)